MSQTLTASQKQSSALPPLRSFYFDMDGTLIDPASHTITSSIQRALKALQQEGIRIALCTTRNMAGAMEPNGMENIHWDGYVLESGNLVLNEQKQVVADRNFDPEDLRILFQRAADRNVPVFFNNGQEVVTFHNSLTDHIIQKYGMGTVPVASWNNERISMITLVSDNEQTIAEVLRPLPSLLARRGGDVNYDICLKDVTKLTGIEALQKAWHLEDAPFGAMGDTEADACMLQAAAAGFAMPWADEKASAAARFKCEDLGGDSIEAALAKAGLIPAAS